MTGPFDFYRAKAVPPDRETFIDTLRREHSLDRAAAERIYDSQLRANIFKSSQYQVLIDTAPNGFGADMVHLSIRRLDREPIRDWRDLQQIKNALVGAECEAFELFPAESRLVDSANQYHLWAFIDPAVRIPCGYTQRAVAEGSFMGSKQRPFNKTTDS